MSLLFWLDLQVLKIKAPLVIVLKIVLSNTNFTGLSLYPNSQSDWYVESFRKYSYVLFECIKYYSSWMSRTNLYISVESIFNGICDPSVRSSYSVYE